MYIYYKCIHNTEVPNLDEVVTTRIDKHLLDQIDKLVASGKFSNRSEAIRDILSRGMNEILQNELIGDLVSEIEDDSEIPDEELLEISGKIFNRPISQIIAEERDR